MNKITIIGSIIALVIGFGIAYTVGANGEFTLPSFTAKTHQTITVGPQQNIQVVATTSRSYLYLARVDEASPVYCNLNGDKQAAVGEGIRLATSTSNIYELYLEKNPYNGAIRCTAAASTTLSVIEFSKR